MHKNVFRQILTVLIVAAVIIVNILANALPFNDVTTSQISDQFEVYFVPAGYAFSIWFLIYIGLAAYTFFQALPAHRENPRLKAIFVPFAISSLANVAWLFCWHYGYYGLSVVVMLVLLVSLIVIYIQLRRNKTRVVPGERWLVHLPFSLYLGWISVATIANISQYLWYIGWDRFGIPETTWAVVMLAAASLIGLLMAVLRRDAAYLLVLVWGFVGIAIEQAGVQPVATAAWIAAGVTAAAAAVIIFTPRQTGWRSRTT